VCVHAAWQPPHDSACRNSLHGAHSFCCQPSLLHSPGSFCLEGTFRSEAIFLLHAIVLHGAMWWIGQLGDTSRARTVTMSPPHGSLSALWHSLRCAHAEAACKLLTVRTCSQAAQHALVYLHTNRCSSWRVHHHYGRNAKTCASFPASGYSVWEQQHRRRWQLQLADWLMYAYSCIGVVRRFRMLDVCRRAGPMIVIQRDTRARGDTADACCTHAVA